MRRVVLVLTGLLAGGTAIAASPEGAEKPVPAVDLGRLKAGPKAVFAPLRAGGLAELTLDPHLQRDAERLLDGARPRAGAVLLVDLGTGRLLAWAERRTESSSAEATAARAPAASVFKLVTTAALFERSSIA